MFAQQDTLETIVNWVRLVCVFSVDLNRVPCFVGLDSVGESPPKYNCVF